MKKMIGILLILMIMTGSVFAFPSHDLYEKPNQMKSIYSFYQMLLPYENKACRHLFDINREWLKQSQNRDFLLRKCDSIQFENSRKGIFEQQLVYEKQVIEILVLQNPKEYGKKYFKLANQKNRMEPFVENFYKNLLFQNMKK